MSLLICGILEKDGHTAFWGVTFVEVSHRVKFTLKKIQFFEFWQKSFLKNLQLRVCFLKIDFRERGRERKIERETSLWQRNIKRLPPICTQTGIEPATFRYKEWPSNWATWPELVKSLWWLVDHSEPLTTNDLMYIPIF